MTAGLRCGARRSPLSNADRTKTDQHPQSSHSRHIPLGVRLPRQLAIDPAGCLAQQSHIHHASRGCSPSACPTRLSQKANPEASKTTTEAPVCRSCGAQLMRVRGQRKRLYCSDTCRARASRARYPTDSSPRTLASADQAGSPYLASAHADQATRFASPSTPAVCQRTGKSVPLRHASGGGARPWASAQAVLFGSLSHASASVAASD
jgi:hypothetical protein